MFWIMSDDTFLAKSKDSKTFSYDYSRSFMDLVLIFNITNYVELELYF